MHETCSTSDRLPFSTFEHIYCHINLGRLTGRNGPLWICGFSHMDESIVTRHRHTSHPPNSKQIRKTDGCVVVPWNSAKEQPAYPPGLHTTTPALASERAVPSTSGHGVHKTPEEGASERAESPLTELSSEAGSPVAAAATTSDQQTSCPADASFEAPWRVSPADDDHGTQTGGVRGRFRLLQVPRPRLPSRSPSPAHDQHHTLPPILAQPPPTALPSLPSLQLPSAPLPPPQTSGKHMTFADYPQRTSNVGQTPASINPAAAIHSGSIAVVPTPTFIAVSDASQQRTAQPAQEPTPLSSGSPEIFNSPLLPPAVAPSQHIASEAAQDGPVRARWPSLSPATFNEVDRRTDSESGEDWLYNIFKYTELESSDDSSTEEERDEVDHAAPRPAPTAAPGPKIEGPHPRYIDVTPGIGLTLDMYTWPPVKPPAGYVEPGASAVETSAAREGSPFVAPPAHADATSGTGTLGDTRALTTAAQTAVARGRSSSPRALASPGAADATTARDRAGAAPAADDASSSSSFTSTVATALWASDAYGDLYMRDGARTSASVSAARGSFSAAGASLQPQASSVDQRTVYTPIARRPEPAAEPSRPLQPLSVNGRTVYNPDAPRPASATGPFWPPPLPAVDARTSHAAAARRSQSTAGASRQSRTSAADSRMSSASAARHSRPGAASSHQPQTSSIDLRTSYAPAARRLEPAERQPHQPRTSALVSNTVYTSVAQASRAVAGPSQPRTTAVDSRLPYAPAARHLEPAAGPSEQIRATTVDMRYTPAVRRPEPAAGPSQQPHMSAIGTGTSHAPAAPRPGSTAGPSRQPTTSTAGARTMYAPAARRSDAPAMQRHDSAAGHPQQLATSAVDARTLHAPAARPFDAPAAGSSMLAGPEPSSSAQDATRGHGNYSRHAGPRYQSSLANWDGRWSK